MLYRIPAMRYRATLNSWRKSPASGMIPPWATSSNSQARESMLRILQDKQLQTRLVLASAAGSLPL